MIIRGTLSEIALLNATWTQSSSLSLQLRVKAWWWWFNNRHINVAVGVLRSGRDKRQMLRIGQGKLPECIFQTQLSFGLIWPQAMVVYMHMYLLAFPTPTDVTACWSWYWCVTKVTQHMWHSHICSNIFCFVLVVEMSYSNEIWCK